MIRSICIAAGLCLSASTAIAQTAAIVQSGEHPSFARLVFPAPADTIWTLDRETPGRAVLRFDPPIPPFDLSTVFDKIPKDRLVDIEEVGGTLSMMLGCDCDVVVQQISSNHIVIDIQDGEPLNAPSIEALAERIEPIFALPLRLPSLATAPSVLNLLKASAEDSAPPSRPEMEPQPDVAIELPQITIRGHGRNGFLPEESARRGTDSSAVPSCPIEAIAARILGSDPQEALAEIPTARAAILDDGDLYSTALARELAETYLRAGWGAEADSLLAGLVGKGIAELRAVASALDSDPDLASPGLGSDASCGPATTTLMLSSGDVPPDWNSVDETAFLAFVDGLPRARRTDLDTRLRKGLIQAERDDTVARLAALRDVPGAAEPRSDATRAAGTSEDAVHAAMDLLVGADGEVDAAAIQNALALQKSIPKGPLQSEFEQRLLRALVLSGHLSDAMPTLRADPALAEGLLTFALESLPEEQVVEVAIRLKPLLGERVAGAAKVAEILTSYGLRDAAREFGAAPITAVRPIGPPPVTPVDTVPERFELDETESAWLARDMAALASSDTLPEDDPRRRLAAEVLDRNTRAPDQANDLAGARATLGESRALSSAIAALVEGGGS